MTQISSSSTLSTYEDEFPTLTYLPKMDSREMTEEKIDEMMSESNQSPPRSTGSGDGNNNFRFAFKNPRSKRQQQRQEHRAKKSNQTALQQISQAGRVKSQSPTKKPKNPESKQPLNAQPKAQEKLDEQSTPTKKRRRRNRRKKKSITESGNQNYSSINDK